MKHNSHKHFNQKKFWNTAIVLAAGKGARLQKGIPKAFIKFQNKTLIEITLQAFMDHPSIHHILLVLPSEPKHLFDYWSKKLMQQYSKVQDVIQGGETRAQSVYYALQSLSDNSFPTDYVFIHDGARPYVSKNLLDHMVQAVVRHKAVVPIIPIRDSIKWISAESWNTIPKYQPFGKYQLAQTPQAFLFPLIYNAYKQCMDTSDKWENFEDDAQVLEQENYPLYFIKGDHSNIKITYPQDVHPDVHQDVHPDVHQDVHPDVHQDEHQDVQRKKYKIHPMFRIGQGYDMHAFGHSNKGDSIMLAGVPIPCDHPLLGTSDADVVLHALTDALLGSLALGDIGEHFPSNDSVNQQRSSVDFLNFALQSMDKLGWYISNVDITIMGEIPKIQPYKEELSQNLRDLLRMDRVSIKATTTDHLGALGRKEGLAAMAVVLLHKLS